MANGEVQNAPDIVEEATDQLGAPESDDWSPDSLSPQQRQQYERGVAAVDKFLSDERTKQYEPTDANRKKLLAYLEQHDLPMSFGGLYVAFEQLSEANELELNSERQPADEEPDASVSQETLDRAADDRLATAGLATRGEEAPVTVENKSEEERIGRRGKPVVAWRNGRAVMGVGS